jgi:peptidoglycan/LPS O-acetylase OafA/YrhL
LGNSAEPRTRYLGLDCLRGCAALAVFLFHGSIYWLDMPWLVAGGDRAVDLFFMMSGFVIAASYEHRLPQLGFLRFVRLRAIRLLPLHALGLVAGSLGAIVTLRWHGEAINAGETPLAFLTNLMFLPSPVSPTGLNSMSPLNDVAWSLLYEMWGAALYAALCKYLTVPVLLAAILASYAWIALHNGELAGWRWTDLPAGGARFAYSFCLGVLVFRRRLSLPLARGNWWLLLGLMILAFRIPAGGGENLLVIGLLLPGILLIGIASPAPPALAGYAATASFVLYVLHIPVFQLMTAMFGHGDIGKPAVVTLSLLILAISSPIIGRFYDLPLRRFLSRLVPDRMPMPKLEVRSRQIGEDRTEPAGTG